MVLALLFLNFVFFFVFVWLFLVVCWAGEVLVELAVLTLLLALSHVWRDTTSPRLLNACAVAIVVFTLGRYGDVTAPALYGRPINLYWDLPSMGSVVAMVARAAPLWIVTAVTLGIAAVLVLMYAGARWSIGRVDEALRIPVTRRVLGFFAAGFILLFTAQAMFDEMPEIPAFATPVSKTYTEQVARIYDTFSQRSSTARLP